MLIRPYYTILLAGLITLFGCKPMSIPNEYHPKKMVAHRDTEYLEASSAPPIRIPADMVPVPMEERYPTPAQSSPASIHALSLIPPGLNPS